MLLFVLINKISNRSHLKQWSLSLPPSPSRCHSLSKPVLPNSINSDCRFAYVEFADADAIEAAKAFDESLFRGRQIKVKVYRNTSRCVLVTSKRFLQNRLYVNSSHMISSNAVSPMCTVFAGGSQKN